MRKYVPWIDFVFYGSVICITISAVLAALFTDQDWTYEKIIAVSTVPTTIVGICLVVVLTKLFTKPSYVTKHGMLVWATDSGPSQKELEGFIDFYLTMLPEIWSFITYSDLEKALKGTKIEFSSKLITVIGIGWSSVDKEGLQRGNNVRVKYVPGMLEKTALAHELHHMLDELVFGISPDYEHKNVLWWYTVSQINAAYRYKK